MKPLGGWASNSHSKLLLAPAAFVHLITTPISDYVSYVQVRSVFKMFDEDGSVRETQTACH